MISVSLPSLLLLSSLGLTAGVRAAVPEIEVFPGETYGVARVHFTIAEPADTSPRDGRFNVSGDHRRVLYPVFVPDAVPTGAEGAVGGPGGFELIFLFRGSMPFKVAASTNFDRRPYGEFRAAIDPKSPGGERSDDSVRGRALMDRWWSLYRRTLEYSRSRDGHYPVIENYLQWYLARRMKTDQSELESASSLVARPLQTFPEFERLADLFIGTESIRLALQRDALLDSDRTLEAATQDLPPATTIPRVDFPDVPEDLEVEALAAVVPAECLYIRFPTFSAFRTLRDRLEATGAQMHDLFLGRAFDAHSKERLETQLALRETVPSKLFGDLVIGEVAILAHDTFVREGSALGILFEVKKPALFLASLNRLRAEAIETSKSWEGGPAEEDLIRFEEGEARLLSALGNRVRSFHVSSGKYHLVTNCRRLARRFLQCATSGGTGSLARDPGFRHMRHLQPPSEPEDAFLFISDPFVRELIGPAYRAEMTRRTRARAEMELIEVARQVARAEQGRDLDLDELVSRGFIPRSLLEHSDRATYWLHDFGVRDSARGFHGSFLPIPDMDVRTLTRSEVYAYESFRRFYRGQWGRVDPVGIRVRFRPAVEEGGAPPTDHLDLTLDISPVARRPYGWLRGFVGEASRRSVRNLDDVLLSMDFELNPALGTPDAAWLHLGLLDFDLPLLFRDGVPEVASWLGRAPLYAVLPCRDTGGKSLRVLLGAAEPADDGFYQMASILHSGETTWGRRWKDYLVLANDRETCRRLASELEFADGLTAQARIRLNEFATRRVRRTLAVHQLARLRSASQSGAEFLSLLHRELKVPLESCQAAARRILGLGVTCPAGGTYRGDAYPIRGARFFASDAKILRPPLATPDDWIRRAETLGNGSLDLFRQLEVGLTLDGISLHSEIRLRLLSSEPVDDDNSRTGARGPGEARSE